MLFQYIYNNNFEIFFPECLLALFILGLLVFGTYYRQQQGRTLMSTTRRMTIFFLLLLFLAEINVTFVGTVANGLFYGDRLTGGLKLGVIVALLNCYWMQRAYIVNQRIVFFENGVLLLISLLGLLLLISANHFLSFYLAIELQSLSFYILALSKRNSSFGAEASLKYFVLGALGSGFLLYGMSYIYGTVGSLNFGQIFAVTYHFYFEDSPYYLMTLCYGLFFFLCGLFFKLGAAPFHMWLPDVYEGAPNHVTLFFATGPKIALIGFLVNFFFHVIPSLALFLDTLFYPVAIASMVIGSLSTFSQWKIKRFLAYSSITHVGFLCLGFLHFSPENFGAVLFYLAAYVVMSMQLWNIYLSMFMDHKPVTYLTDWTSLWETNKYLAFWLVVTMFSMAGIPPFIGFFSKLFLFVSVIQQQYLYVVLIALLCSVFTTVYYLRVVKIVYFDKKRRLAPLRPLSKSHSLLIWFLGQPIVWFFACPVPFLTMLEGVYLSGVGAVFSLPTAI